jgi:hypothetical protein
MVEREEVVIPLILGFGPDVVIASASLKGGAATTV